jgi:hypothetical protein
MICGDGSHGMTSGSNRGQSGHNVLGPRDSKSHEFTTTAGAIPVPSARES